VKDADERVSWDGLSTELRSALVERLQSPSLFELGIEQILNIPISLVTNFTHLTRLSLACDMFDVRSPQISPPIPLQVQAFDLRFTTTAKSTVTTVLKFLPMPRLRHLSISMIDDYTLQAAQEVIRSFATSIKSVSWCYRSPGQTGKFVVVRVIVYGDLTITTAIDLRMIHNLERLNFTMVMVKHYGRFKKDLASLGQRLAHREVTKALRELMIEVHAVNYPTLDDAILSLASTEEWEALDAIQWSSTLQNVYVYLNWMDHPPDAAERLQFLMQPRLPRLAERGILSAGLETQDIRGWIKVWD
jgi:hypothetical protein